MDDTEDTVDAADDYIAGPDEDAIPDAADMVIDAAMYVAEEPEPEDQVVGAGYWANWVASWDPQTDWKSCGPACVAQIIEAFTGYEQTDAQYVQIAQSLGKYMPGVWAQDIPTLFQYGGVSATTYSNGNLDFVADQLDAGNAVIAQVDMTEYNGQAAPTFGEGAAAAPHYVVVTQVDPVTQTVVISDPWGPNGGQIQMSYSQFQASWSDVGNIGTNIMIVADRPGQVRGGCT